MPKIIRITTSPMALRHLLHGQMRYMKEQGFEVIMISADGKERAEVIEYESCAHIIVPMTRLITPFQDLSCLYQLIKIFKREKPDIVHTHTPKAGLLGMLAARICSVKIKIHTVAGLPLMVEKGFKFQLLKLVEKATYAAANHVWPNSYSLKNYIEKNYLAKSKKLDVIGIGSSNGIDLNKFDNNNLAENVLADVRDQINFSQGNIYLLFVGRMVTDKGISELVGSFKKLSKGNSKLQLILVGPFEAELDPLPHDILKEISLNPNIKHIPWSNNIAAFMAICDYFIFPSHREGFPNVLLQAGAIGIPVICSDISGNIDLITDHQTGRLFKCGDENALTQQLLQALNNDSQSLLMANNLSFYIHQNFDQQEIWRIIYEKYIELIKD